MSQYQDLCAYAKARKWRIAVGVDTSGVSPKLSKIVVWKGKPGKTSVIASAEIKDNLEIAAAEIFQKIP